MVRLNVRITLKVVERDINWALETFGCLVGKDLGGYFVCKNILDYKTDEEELAVRLQK